MEADRAPRNAARLGDADDDNSDLYAGSPSESNDDQALGDRSRSPTSFGTPPRSRSTSRHTRRRRSSFSPPINEIESSYGGGSGSDRDQDLTPRRSPSTQSIPRRWDDYRDRSPSPSRVTPPIYEYEERSMRRDRYRSPSYSPSHRKGYASRRRRHGRYEPLTSGDADAGEETQLVHTVSIGPEGKALSDPNRVLHYKKRKTVGSVLQPWSQRRASLRCGVDTELLVINAAESITDDRGKSTVTLYCQENVLDSNVAAAAAAVPPNQMHWLHIRYSTDVIKVLKSLIISCPFVQTNLKSLALRLVERICPQDDDSFQSSDASGPSPTAVSRFDGENRDDPFDSCTTAFVSTPYAIFGETKQQRDGNGTMQSLLSAHYGYDVGAPYNRRQVLSYMQQSLAEDILNIAQLRCLLLGSNVLITWGEVPLSAICKDSIAVDESKSRPPVTVRISELRGREYYSYVSHETSFAELLARVTKLTSMVDFNLQEGSIDGRLVTPEFWIQLLEESSTKLEDIRLTVSWKRPSTNRTHGRVRGHHTDRLRGARYELGEGSEEFGRDGSIHGRRRGDTVYGTVSSHLPSRMRPPERSSSRSRARYHDTTYTPRLTARPRPVTDMTRTKPVELQRRSGAPRYRQAELVRNTSDRERRPYAQVGVRASPRVSRQRRVSRNSDLEARDDEILTIRRPPSFNRSMTLDGGRDAKYDPKLISKGKIVNDKSLRTKAKYTYHLSSSGSESDDRRTQSFRASRKAASRAVSLSGARSGAGETRSESERAEQPESFLTPFLMWRVTQSGVSEGARQEVDEGGLTTLVRLLHKVDKSLTASRTYKKLQPVDCECSLDDILSRYETLSPSTSEPLADLTTLKGKAQAVSNDGKPESMPLDDQEGANPDTRTHDMDTKDDRGQGQQAEADPASGEPSLEQNLYVNVMEQVNELTTEILARSTLLMALFVPLNRGNLGELKLVVDRYWGSLDLIFRQLRYAALADAAEGEQTWVVRGSCHYPGAPPLPARAQGDSAMLHKCDACDEKREYSLVDALEHLHAGHAHTQRPSHDIPTRPHEDPCTVWLRGTKTIQKGTTIRDLAENLQGFADDLDEILEQAQELHMLVARPTPEARLKSGSAANFAENAGDDEKEHTQNREDRGEKQPHKEPPKSSEDEKQQQASTTPPLPTSLLRAFEHIIVLFANQVRVVFLMMRNAEISHHRLKHEKLLQGTKRYVSTMRNTQELLDKAREEVILGITAESATAVKLGAVGLEYLVATAMTNVQSGAFRLQGVNGFGGVREGPEGLIKGSRRGTVTWTRDIDDRRDQAPTAKEPAVAKASMASLDLLAIYASQLAALEFTSYRHPQRKAFLAIRALEEELSSLKDVMVAQRVCLEDFARVADPKSFRVTDGVRVARYPFEESVLRRGKNERRREMEQLSRMLRRAGNLRVGVKESIEVLDEGHGKAIRVFTLVTLFFLPLSFITSFFGMNTSDIRDMPRNQQIYWTIAVPVTVVVLASAYLYAYKGEDIIAGAIRIWPNREASPALSGDAVSGRPRSSRFRTMSFNPLRRRKKKKSTVKEAGRTRRKDTWGSMDGVDP